MCLDASLCIDWSVWANIAVALATGFLAWKTLNLATSTEQMAREAKEGSIRQIGVQTWLTMEERFDSPRMHNSRRKLAELLSRYNSGPDEFFGNLHNAVTEEVLELFESIGTVYNLGLLNNELAKSSFGFYAVGWWKHSHLYIENERNRLNDNDIFIEFQKFAEEMEKQNLDIDITQFVKDEMQLSRLEG